MHNYALLKALSAVDNPIILSAGFLQLIRNVEASNYIKQSGDNKTIFCERGIRTLSQKPASRLTYRQFLSYKITILNL